VDESDGGKGRKRREYRMWSCEKSSRKFRRGKEYNADEKEAVLYTKRHPTMKS